jgi:hypothetical protein
MVNNWPDNVLGWRESISLRASFDSHSSSDLRPTSLGTAGWVVGLVSVSFERVTLEGRGFGTASSCDLVGVAYLAPLCYSVDQISGLGQSLI